VTINENFALEEVGKDAFDERDTNTPTHSLRLDSK